LKNATEAKNHERIKLDFSQGSLKETLNLGDVENQQLEDMINDILGPLADDYALKILAATRDEGKTVRELSRELDIPIATCYRRVEELEENDLLEVKEKKLTQDGKRATVLRTNVSFVEITFGFENQSLNINIESAEDDKRK